MYGNPVLIYCCNLVHCSMASRTVYKTTLHYNTIITRFVANNMYNIYGGIAKWLAYPKTVQKAKVPGSLPGGRKCSDGIYSPNNQITQQMRPPQLSL